MGTKKFNKYSYGDVLLQMTYRLYHCKNFLDATKKTISTSEIN